VGSELLQPAAATGEALTDQDVVLYEKPLGRVQDGIWNEAFRLLHQVPAEDRVKDFLTVYIAQNGRVAPPDWNGTIRLPEK